MQISLFLYIVASKGISMEMQFFDLMRDLLKFTRTPIKYTGEIQQWHNVYVYKMLILNNIKEKEKAIVFIAVNANMSTLI